jgi:16S rRNA (guanine527-N7)-methyltransferase
VSAAPLTGLLAEAQRRGFLGPGPVSGQLTHAERLADLIGASPASFLDLGSGSGLPGLVLASRWPAARGILLDSAARRCSWLIEALDLAGFAPRVEVRCGRAEVLARQPELREAFPLVVARSFGPPATTAECAVGFLAPGGALVVSEPPGDARAADQRWPVEGLADLGLSPPEARRTEDTGVVIMRRVGPMDDRWPRRTGVPGKRPLWKPAS